MAKPKMDEHDTYYFGSRYAKQLTMSAINMEVKRIWRSLNAGKANADNPPAVVVHLGDGGFTLRIGTVSHTLDKLEFSLDDFSECFIMPTLMQLTQDVMHTGWASSCTVGPDVTDKVAAIIEERGGLQGTGRYGPFIDNAVIAQKLKNVYRDSPNWAKLNDAQKEAFDLIAMKQSRILSGDPNYQDNWLDCEGYLRLARHNWQKDVS